MILINSAAYINSDLTSEFGKLPPCMLPVQNKRLYEHQCNMLLSVKNENEKIYLTLPKSYSDSISDFDKQVFNQLHIIPIYIKDGLQLGQSVINALNYIGNYNERVIMLHGDTLFSSITLENNDIFSYTTNIGDNYHWDSTDKKEFFTGYFSILNQVDFLRSVISEEYNFIKGIVKYMEFHSGKGVVFNGWKDFGHINTYYRSISEMTTERAFNTLKIIGKNKPQMICKASADTNKMEAEESWFKNIPSLLQVYTPKIFDKDNKLIQNNENGGRYYMEYFYLPSLANLFVFGKNPIFVWQDIICACKDFINEEYRQSESYDDAMKQSNIVQQNDKMYYYKTTKRLKDTNIDLDTKWTINGIETPSINEILTELDGAIHKNDKKYCSIVHGDFCFSNILYDFKSQTIKVLDPRGRDTEGNLSIFGDIRYEVAKLAHSIIGMYDFIIAGRYYYNENSATDLELSFEHNDDLENLQKWFIQQKFATFNFSELDAYIIMIHLFLSMMPLHSDRPDRQKAFFANALRLYVDYKNKL